MKKPSSQSPSRRGGKSVRASRLRIEVDGIVQGVGFRPFIYRLATDLSLSGWVTNTSDGVTIEVEGGPEALKSFLDRLRRDAPPLARISAVRFRHNPAAGYAGFSIRHSLAAADPKVLLSPDTSICPDCISELLDPKDRRYRYPFINCTNCGPRYTIISRVPYDRPNTSMAVFEMCPLCQAEYDDPANRRFHAQPNACHDCGPRLTLVRSDGTDATGDPLEESLQYLRGGKVLAIRGLGGYHLAVDASNEEAVRGLRLRKGREEKPLAIMVPGLAEAGMICAVSDLSAGILRSTESPIVLMPRLPRPELGIAPSVAPKSRYFGVMLPYTPLHVLLMQAFPVLVMTSANLSEEPLCARNDEARIRLQGIADAYLTHDRDIVLRCDDSVVRPSGDGKGPIVLRRARGFVPAPVSLPVSGPPVLALGPEMKGSICMTRRDRAFIGQHLGDLKNLQTEQFLKEVASHMMDILEVSPEALVCDLHPDYMTTRLATERGDIPWPAGLPVHRVQHHHAHVLSAQAEAGLTGPTVGVALDGTGYGPDGTVWGGEILLVDGTRMRRLARFKHLWMPGGEKAVMQGFRMSISCLVEIFGRSEAGNIAARLFPFLGQVDLEVLLDICSRRVAGILTSSAGRLFDAVSALLGVCHFNSYEGQAAVELEMLTEPARADILPFLIEQGEDGVKVINLLPAFASLTELHLSGIGAPPLAGMFHSTVSRALADCLESCLRETPGTPRDIPLGGGVFQNEALCRLLREDLSGKGMAPVFNRSVPTNDGGISLGQAVYGLLALKEGTF